MEEIKEQLFIIFTKFWTYIALIALTALAKAVYITQKYKNTTMFQILSAYVVAFVIGVVAAVLCQHYFPYYAMLAGPAASLGSNGILNYMMTLKRERIEDAIIRLINRKK